MKIDHLAHVSIDYRLTLDSGEEIDRSEPGSPLSFILGIDAIVPGLERQLTGMETGQVATLVVTPEEGYGPVRPDLLRELSRDQFPDEMEIEVGMIFESHSHSGPIHLRVKEIDGDKITGDLNHPLAGETLHFAITVVGVRAATPEEIAAAENQHSCAPSDCGSCGCGEGGSCH